MKNIMLSISAISLFSVACNTKPTERTAEQIQAKNDEQADNEIDPLRKELEYLTKK